MNDRLREQLLGYALGALNDDEQQEIERRLTVDPALREELEAVQTSLEPLAEAYEDHAPPPGLAERACAYVAHEAERLQVVLPGSGSKSRHDGSLEGKPRWNIADWVVVSGICACAVLLFFPAILNSRILSRMTMCQDNLRNLGTSLVQYSEYVGHGFFPSVATEGNQSFAGVFAARLKDASLLDDERCLICPDSSLAADLDHFRVPNVCEIESAQGPQVWIMQRFCGGSYAYNLGVVVDGRHRPVRNLNRPTFALMADAPVNAWGPVAHDHGRNILYEDMHISFVVDHPQMKLADDPFVNRFGRCEAGIGANDAVVAPSDCPPIRNRIVLDVTQ